MSDNTEKISIEELRELIKKKLGQYSAESADEVKKLQEELERRMKNEK